MGWIRDESGLEAAGSPASGTAQIRYLMPGGEDPIVVRRSPTSIMGGDDGATPLPGYDSPHPLDPVLLLDTYEVNTDGAVCTIVARYSSDRRYRFNPQQHIGLRWRRSFDQIVFDIPFAQKVKELVGRGPDIPPGGQGPPQPGDAVYAFKWKYQTQKVLGKVSRVGMTFPVPYDRVNALLAAIDHQHENMQLIGGGWWHFEGGEVVDSGRDNDYQCTLNWYREKGVVIHEGDEPLMRWPHSMAPNPLLTGLGTPASPRDWAQPPFHRTVIRPPTSGKADDPPTFTAILPFDVDANGFAELAPFIPPP